MIAKDEGLDGVERNINNVVGGVFNVNFLELYELFNGKAEPLTNCLINKITNINETIGFFKSFITDG